MAGIVIRVPCEKKDKKMSTFVLKTTRVGKALVDCSVTLHSKALRLAGTAGAKDQRTSLVLTFATAPHRQLLCHLPARVRVCLLPECDHVPDRGFQKELTG